MVYEAFAHVEVASVVAHTLAEPGPSPAVLERVRFRLSRP